FGKTLEHNLTLLKNLERLRVHDRPLVVGVSRKSFLGKLMNSAEMSAREAPTIALTGILRARGADILRVHDVKANVAALRAAEAVLSFPSRARSARRCMIWPKPLPSWRTNNSARYSRSNATLRFAFTKRPASR